MASRFGRYELLGPIGRGGMAELLLARYRGPEGFEKRLVVKRVLPKLSGDPRLLRLFFEEARTQVQLSHANLVSVLDFGRVGADYFLALEYVPGCDLGALIGAARASGERLSPSLVAAVGSEICRGLAYVHRRGFVHRDVAPRNILLSTEGEVKLSDFGIALPAANAPTVSVPGTLAYVAPEQARGEPSDGRADLYALGMVIVEALTGVRPRVGTEGEATLAAARLGTPPSVEGPLASVVARATAPSPADRFADAEEMRAALDEAARPLGDREAALRELRGRVTAAARVIGEAGTGSVGPPSDEPGSYFSDSRTSSFVDEVLAPPPFPKARRPLRWAAAATIALGLSVAVAFVLRGAPSRIVAVAAAPASPPSAVAPAPAVEPTPTFVEKPPATERGAPASPVRSGTRRSQIPPSTARLTVLCAPWCTTLVDGKERGSDGRQHALQVPPGRHTISARRLDDEEVHAVDLAPGADETIVVTFR